jgi:predicted RNase H-like HicB family nuclease
MRYVDTALSLAQYERDENGIVVAIVPDASGFFSQGDTFEEARTNLRDAIEGNVLLALQLGLPIPAMPGVDIEEQDTAAKM